MMEASRLGRYPVAVIVALGLVGAIHNASRTGHGQEPPPAAAAGAATSDPLRSPPFDRLTLIDGTILIIDPVSPRPVPAPEPARSKTKVRLKGTKTEIPLEGNIGLPGEPSKFKTPKALPMFRAVGVVWFAVNWFSAMTYGGKLAILFTGCKPLRSSDLR